MPPENDRKSEMSPGVADGATRTFPTSSADISLLEFLSTLLKRWRIVAGLPFVAAAVVIGISFLIPVTYTATTTFVPEARSQGRLPSGLAGLAGQLGVSLSAEASESPTFYADVVKSRELLERILLTQYQDPRKGNVDSDSTTLLRILKVKGRSPEDSLYRGVKRLNQLVSVNVDKQTNIVRLSVEAHYPVLAAAVANRFVTYVDDFNAKTRQSQARERRKFIEQRLSDGEQQLRTTEEELRSFYDRNRSWQQSPQLVFEEGRLRRQVDIRQDVYLTLRREYETARIEEVNDTPIITVIDRATPPTEKSGPKRALLAMVAFLLGAFCGVLWAGSAEYFERAKSRNDKDYRVFSEHLAQVAQAIRVRR